MKTRNEKIHESSEKIRAEVKQEYIKLLQNHDWYSEYSDDQRVWENGSIEYQKILDMQIFNDKDWSIYNTYAPDEYKRGEKK